ncbi:MAG: DUF1559 domain-containing protein [Planctomycetota bacterium]|nr:DUF1559 domain-containing protein [Planctomycetota bacterium]
MKKRGFTLIELLTVLSIVAVALALAIPGVTRATQDARQTHCKNNLKMLGLALHNYHDTYVSFPPGWVSRSGEPGLGGRIGWQSSILPYVDQAPLYNQIDFRATSPIEADGKPNPLFQTPIKDYRCTQDTTPNLNTLRGEFATSSYSGNYGPDPAPRLRGLRMSDSWPGAVESPSESRGIFARNSSMRLAKIVDGSSNTIMVGERGATSGSGIWAGVTDNGHEDDAVTDTSHRSRINTGSNSFSSRHQNMPGANFLLCDGSVRFVSAEINSQPGPEMGLFQRIGCINDGFEVGEF